MITCKERTDGPYVHKWEVVNDGGKRIATGTDRADALENAANTLDEALVTLHQSVSESLGDCEI